MGAKDKNTIIDPELQKIQEQEKARVAAEAAAAKAQRTTLDNQEIADLTAAQTAQAQALKDNNEALYKNQGEIIKAAEEKWNTAKQKDETARKRENAFRYISGLGDALSGVANLIGTAHGASNQNQKYNSHAVVQKAEEARKARKLDIESQSKRLDELSAQLQNLKAAGSLKEAELAAANAKEVAALKATQRKAADEAAYKERQMRVDEQNAKSAAIRAEAYEYSKENPTSKTTTTKTTTPKPVHSFELPGGEMLDIPNHRWTDTFITSVYDIIPDELKTKRARLIKDVAGRDVEQKDASGNTVYYTPTKQEMLNDIVRAAKVDENVANALRRNAKAATTGANDPEFE